MFLIQTSAELVLWPRISGLLSQRCHDGSAWHPLFTMRGNGGSNLQVPDLWIETLRDRSVKNQSSCGSFYNPPRSLRVPLSLAGNPDLEGRTAYRSGSSHVVKWAVCSGPPLVTRSDSYTISAHNNKRLNCRSWKRLVNVFSVLLAGTISC